MQSGADASYAFRPGQSGSSFILLWINPAAARADRVLRHRAAPPRNRVNTEPPSIPAIPATHPAPLQNLAVVQIQHRLLLRPAAKHLSTPSSGTRYGNLAHKRARHHRLPLARRHQEPEPGGQRTAIALSEPIATSSTSCTRCLQAPCKFPHAAHQRPACHAGVARITPRPRSPRPRAHRILRTALHALSRGGGSRSFLEYAAPVRRQLPNPPFSV